MQCAFFQSFRSFRFLQQKVLRFPEYPVKSGNCVFSGGRRSRIYIYIYIDTCVWMFVYLFAYLLNCFVCVCVCMYVRTYERTYVRERERKRERDGCTHAFRRHGRRAHPWLLQALRGGLLHHGTPALKALPGVRRAFVKSRPCGRNGRGSKCGG